MIVTLNNNDSNFDENLAHAMSHATQITKLYIFYEQEETKLNVIAALIAQATNLEELSIKNNTPPSFSSRHQVLSEEHVSLLLPSLLCCQRVRYISIDIGRLSGECIGLIIEVAKQLRHLEQLVLNRNKISDEGGVRLAVLLENSTIRELNLINTGVGDQTAIAIAGALIKSPYIRRLYLSCNAITRIGSEHMVAAKWWFYRANTFGTPYLEGCWLESDIKYSMQAKDLLNFKKKVIDPLLAFSQANLNPKTTAAGKFLADDGNHALIRRIGAFLQETFESDVRVDRMFTNGSALVWRKPHEKVPKDWQWLENHKATYFASSTTAPRARVNPG